MEEFKKSRIGRPPLPKGVARHFTARLKLNDKEKKMIDEVSKRNGINRSKWMRKTLLKAADTAQ